ncbi:MAG: 2-oxoacid:acceptor oxidoreductase subunit alpha [Gemmatimonadota bacterium]|nr:2-oxoacid:acceptor oxidoreductase subunit alpha [Gemmatimonadota bacterium]
MSSKGLDLTIAIGGAAGQGIATPGNILARILVRRGLHLYAYNAYQSIIRGGHILLMIRTRDQEVHSHGDKVDVLLCLNQDTMDRHLGFLLPGARVIYDADKVTPGEAPEGVVLCPMPIAELAGDSKNKLIQNTIALGVMISLLGVDFSVLDDALTQLFKRKGAAVVDENVSMARAGFDHAEANFDHVATPLPDGGKPLAVWTGNQALAMGGAAAGVKFYAAYPMSPSTGVLHWMAQNARSAGILVRQVEDEIGVANMVIGAAHTGVRAMCATSGGGFALMTEAIGAASMMEIPVVYINVMRAGPSTGVPTKTEQGDLWQALGASQGDFERFIVAPKDSLDAFHTMADLFNYTDRAQCPGILISDLLISEGTYSVDPDAIEMHPKIDRGALVTDPSPNGNYLRYALTDSGISPRVTPGYEGFVHTVATDEHDEDGVLISDEYTHPHKRRRMVEKRARKFKTVAADVPAPVLEGPAGAEITMVGCGSTYGVIREAIERLADQGVVVNHLPITWLVPFHADEVSKILTAANKVLIVENNFSGQFARYLRSETGFSAAGHIRKYDGEPFMPHHVVDGVLDLVKGDSEIYVPYQEMIV